MFDFCIADRKNARRYVSTILPPIHEIPVLYKDENEPYYNQCRNSLKDIAEKKVSTVMILSIRYFSIRCHVTMGRGIAINDFTP